MKKKQKGDGKRGCLFLIVGTLLVIVGMAAYIFLTGRLTAALIGSRYAGQAVYAIMTIQIPCIIVAFLLMDGILILQYLPSQEEYDKAHGSPLIGQSTKGGLGTRHTTNLVSIGLGICVVICAFISASTYRLVTEEGIETHCFVRLNRYGWDQVNAYRVDCDDDKGLSVTFLMNDGHSCEITRGTISATPEFDEKYSTALTTDTKESVLAFAVAIDEKLTAMDIPCNVTHLEKAVAFYRAPYPALWPYVRTLINYEDVYLDDETVAGTRPSETPEETAPAETGE